MLWWEIKNSELHRTENFKVKRFLTIIPVVCGCGLSFKASGLQNHQRQSLDSRCKDCNDDRDFDSDLDPHDIINNVLEIFPEATVDQIDVDSAGDYFGDYSDYYDMEIGNLAEELTTTDEEYSDDDFDNLTIGTEIFEPERQPHSLETHPLAPENQVDEAPSPLAENSLAKEKATRLRGGAEIELRKQPFIVKFTSGPAGAVHAEQVVDENLNVSYTRKVGSAENPFFPFSSKLEWEIARWSKMRGPTSTAFTELLKMEGVSF